MPTPPQSKQGRHKLPEEDARSCPVQVRLKPSEQARFARYGRQRLAPGLGPNSKLGDGQIVREAALAELARWEHDHFCETCGKPHSDHVAGPDEGGTCWLQEESPKAREYHR